MKKRATAFLLGAALLSLPTALAQETTYVFPYEGFRYTRQADETVLTQTNLDEHAALLESLGTTKEAVLSSYVASGIVMEVIPDDGGQMAVRVVDAGDFADVQHMTELRGARRDAFLAQFAESGLYEDCAWTDTDPACVRLTSSAMYASMPVYSLRYAMVHLGRLYVLEQTIVGRAPEAQDDARMVQLLGSIKLLATVSEATPAPTAVPTPTPEPTAAPTPGVAEVTESHGALTVSGVPAYTADGSFTVVGEAASSAAVRILADGKQIAKTTAQKDGAYSVAVRLPHAGEIALTVETDEASAAMQVRFELPEVSLTITEPESMTFTGTNTALRGITEPNATVYVSGKGIHTNVKANRNGVFTVRIFIDDDSTQTFSLRVKADGFAETMRDVTLTRVYTEREQIAIFRQKMIDPSYQSLAETPEKYAGKQFILRGKVVDYTDYNGSPCALVLVSNPATGVWVDPIYVVLSKGMEAAQGDVLTFYLVGEGLTLPADGAYTANGAETEAPVARAAFVVKNK